MKIMPGQISEPVLPAMPQSAAPERHAAPVVQSQATFAFETIRRDIVLGVHIPGKKLKILDLAAELTVNPSAVREALSRLVPEELVVARDQRGFAVAPLSIEDLEDLTDLRCEVEAIALRRSLERGGIDWEAGLLAATHRVRATSPLLPKDKPTVNPEWRRAHADFHTALVAACGSRRLLRLHAQLYEQSERYRGLSAHGDVSRKVHDEHQAIVDRALARDIDGVIAEMIDHTRLTTRLLITAARAGTLPTSVVAD